MILCNFKIGKKYIDRLKLARKVTQQQMQFYLIAKGKVKGINVIAGAQVLTFIGGLLVLLLEKHSLQAVQHSIEK